jgi:hypothetical protein
LARLLGLGLYLGIGWKRKLILRHVLNELKVCIDFKGDFKMEIILLSWSFGILFLIINMIRTDSRDETLRQQQQACRNLRQLLAAGKRK